MLGFKFYVRSYTHTVIVPQSTPLLIFNPASRDRSVQRMHGKLQASKAQVQKTSFQKVPSKIPYWKMASKIPSQHVFMGVLCWGFMLHIPNALKISDNLRLFGCVYTTNPFKCKTHRPPKSFTHPPAVLSTTVRGCVKYSVVMSVKIKPNLQGDSMSTYTTFEFHSWKKACTYRRL